MRVLSTQRRNYSENANTSLKAEPAESKKIQFILVSSKSACIRHFRQIANQPARPHMSFHVQSGDLK